MAKTLIFGYFGYESAKIAKMRFFFENRALSLFLSFLVLFLCKKSKKSLVPFSLKVAKSAKSAHFEPKKIFLAKMRFFLENPAVLLFLFYYVLFLCKKSKKSLEPFSVTFDDSRST